MILKKLVEVVMLYYPVLIEHNTTEVNCMKTVKKLIAGILTVIMILGLAACGKAENTVAEKSTVLFISNSDKLKTDRLTDKYSNMEITMIRADSNGLLPDNADTVCMDMDLYAMADADRKAELVAFLNDSFSCGRRIVFLSGKQEVTPNDIGQIMEFKLLCDISFEPKENSPDVQQTSKVQVYKSEKTVGYSLQNGLGGLKILNCFFDRSEDSLSFEELLAIMLGASSDTAVELKANDIIATTDDPNGILVDYGKYAVPVIYGLYDSAKAQQTLYLTKIAEAETHVLCELRTMMNIEIDKEGGYDTLKLNVQNSADYENQYTSGYLPTVTNKNGLWAVSEEIPNRYLMMNTEIIPCYNADKRSCSWSVDFSRASSNFSFALLEFTTYSDSATAKSTYDFTLNKSFLGLATDTKQYVESCYVVVN